jgi:hypothetical protein
MRTSIQREYSFVQIIKERWFLRKQTTPTMGNPVISSPLCRSAPLLATGRWLAVIAQDASNGCNGLKTQRESRLADDGTKTISGSVDLFSLLACPGGLCYTTPPATRNQLSQGGPTMSAVYYAPARVKHWDYSASQVAGLERIIEKLEAISEPLQTKRPLPSGLKSIKPTCGGFCRFSFQIMRTCALPIQRML